VAAGRAVDRLSPHGRPPARRVALVAAVAFVAGLAAGVPLLFVADDGAAEVAGPVAPEHRLRLEYLELIREGQRQRAAGEPMAAAVAFRRAEALAPERPRASALRQEAERAAHAEQEGAILQRQVALQVEAAEAALAGRRYEEALATARVVLEIEPDNEIAGEVAERSRAALARAARESRARAAATDAVAEPVVAEGGPAASPAVDEEAPVADVAFLTIYFEAAGEGRLILNADDVPLVNIGYDHYERVGLLRRKRFFRSAKHFDPFEVAPGATTLEFWVTPTGEAARAGEVRAQLPAGEIRNLRIILDDADRLSWSLE
jgi:hypothetical protein